MSALEQAVATKTLKLAEHLMQAHKRKIVAPLMATTALLVARRFRAQRKAMDGALRRIEPLLGSFPSALPAAASAAIIGAFRDFSYPLFDDRLDSITRDAFDGGWETAAAQIGLDKAAPARQFNDLVTDEIDGTTRDGIIAAARDAFQGGSTFAALINAVDNVFKDAVDNRSEMIATTEIASAFNAGASAVVTVASNQGLRVEKLWSTEDDPCDICQANADQGWVDADETFDSGDDEPPAHPRCVCGLDIRTAED